MIDPSVQFLKTVREALVVLHKTLVDSERITYEQAVGPICSPHYFLQLLTRDPWFAWLQPFSQLIVSLDEALEEPVTEAGSQALIRRTGQLLVASETGDGFARHYFEALQRDPDVVMAHAEVMKLINPRQVAR